MAVDAKDFKTADDFWKEKMLEELYRLEKEDEERLDVYNTILDNWCEEIPPMPDFSECRWIPNDHRRLTGQQLAFIALPHREALFGGSAGGGKGGRCPDRANPSYNEDMETKVLTPAGFRLFGDIKSGDAVCSPDGTVSRVIGVYDRGERQFYRVTLDDGSSVEASDDHLWAYSIAGQRKMRKRDVPSVPSGLQQHEEWNYRMQSRCKVVTTVRLKEIVDRASADKDDDTRARYVQLPLTAPVAMTGAYPYAVLPPYTLGVLIGNGYLSGDCVAFTHQDKFVSEEVARELDGTYLVGGGAFSNGCYWNSILAQVGTSLESPRRLLEREHLYGTHSWDKFIPHRILRAPISTRFAFVQGLFDTDGYIDDRGHVEYVTVSEQLANDVQYILRSLGFKATLTEKQSTYTYKGEKLKGRLAYRFYVQGPHLERLFRLPRKLGRAQPFNGGNVWPSHRVVSVEPTVIDNCRCISVDNPNGLYVTDDFIVTHNSEAALCDMLFWADDPYFSGLILRKTFSDLNKEDAIMDRCRKWLAGTAAKWREDDHRFTFPSGATLSFGHMEHESDRFMYQSAAWQKITFDELTQFPKICYTYMFSRNRRLKNSSVPLAIRGTSNPGNIGHEWVRDRFVKPKNPLVMRPFIPSRMDDNPYLDREAYEQQLSELDVVDYQQLRWGNWDVMAEGNIFNGSMFEETYKQLPIQIERVISFWDAASKAKEKNDEWANVEIAVGSNWQIYVLSCWHGRVPPSEAQDKLIERYRRGVARFGSLYECYGEDASSMTAIVDIMPQFAPDVIIELVPTENKDLVWHTNRVIRFFKTHRVVFPDEAIQWKDDIRDQCILFPNGKHDDMVKCITGAIEVAMRGWTAYDTSEYNEIQASVPSYT